jgi:hypothetical protein
MDKDLSHELLEGPRIEETSTVCLLVRTTKRSPIKVGGGGGGGGGCVYTGSSFLPS